MVEAEDVRKKVVTKEQKEERCFAKLTAEAAVVSVSAALKVPKAALIIVSPTAEVAVVVTRVAAEQQGGNPGCALDMEGAKDVKWKIVLRVPKGIPVSAYLMVEGAVVSTLNARRVHKAVRCTARRMEEVSGALC